MDPWALELEDETDPEQLVTDSGASSWTGSPTWTTSGGDEDDDLFDFDKYTTTFGEEGEGEGEWEEKVVELDEFNVSSFNPASYTLPAAKRLTAPKAASSSSRDGSVAESKFVRLQQCVALPQHIITLINCGDVDALHALVETHFTEDCSLKTKILPKAVTGRHHIFTFFLRLVETFPDGVFVFKRSKLGKLDEVTFKVALSGTSLCTVGARNEYLVPKDCFISRAGEMTKKIIASARRYFFPCEKDKLLTDERKIASGQAMPFITGDLQGKFHYLPRSAGGPVRVSRVEFGFALKGMRLSDSSVSTNVPVKQLQASAAAAAAW